MRGMLVVPSIRDIKSMHIIGARSIPKSQRSGHLELYTLSREKERLEKELFLTDRRKKTAKKQLFTVNKRFRRLYKELNEQIEPGTNKHMSSTPLKTMAIKY